MSYYWPIGLVILSNVIYHICAKLTSTSMSIFASLIITYLTAAAACAVFYFIFNPGGNLISEYRHLDWVPFVFGLCIVGLEVGSICAYKAGWNINSANIVEAAGLAIALLIVGYFLFKEGITWTKLLGTGLLIGGIFFINK